MFTAMEKCSESSLLFYLCSEHGSEISNFYTSKKSMQCNKDGGFNPPSRFVTLNQNLLFSGGLKICYLTGIFAAKEKYI